MKNAMFVIPHLRGHGFVLTTMPDPEIGAEPTFDDLEALDVLLSGWSGLLRGVALAGYRCVELSVEINPVSATERLVCNPATLGVGLAPLVPDGLGDIRSDAPSMMAVLTVDPMWPFGERAGAPIALDVSVDDVEDVHFRASTERRGWIVFTAGDASLMAARGDLITRGLAVAEALAQAVAIAFHTEPDPRGAPTGLGFLFDERAWWFPPEAPDYLDPNTRGLRSTLTPITVGLRDGEIDVTTFAIEQVLRRKDPGFLAPGGSFDQLTKAWSNQSAAAAVDAYVQRLGDLTAADHDNGVPELADLLDNRFTWTDAVMLMIEHGVIGAAQQLLPGVPETSLSGMPLPSVPEWTTPQLTGQWDAKPSVTRFDTLILNQAGTAISGFWQQHHAFVTVRYQLTGSQSAGNRNGGPLTFDVQVWLQASPDDQGPFQTIAGQLHITAVPGGPADLLFDVDVGEVVPAYEFARSLTGMDGAHPTERSMDGLSTATRNRLRRLRDAPLHYEELKLADQFLVIAATHIQRYLEERPDFVGHRTLLGEFLAEVDAVQPVPTFVHNPDLRITAGRYMQRVLARLRARGSDSGLDILIEMFRLAYSEHDCVELQRRYDLELFPNGYNNLFLYQWRLVGTSMWGGGVGVQIASGTGTFEIRRVDANGQQVGAVVSRTIDLTATDVGNVYGTSSGPGDFKDWMTLFPTNRDVTPFLDGATLSLVGASGSVFIVESTGTIEVEIQPNDGLPPLMGYISPALLEFPIFAPIEDTFDPADAKERADQVNDLIDTVKDFVETAKEKGVTKGIKGFVKALKPEAKFSSLDGWVRAANGTTTKPGVVPVPVSAYSTQGDTWARFATDKYELTSEFRDAIRQFLLENLPLLTGLGEVVIEGNASQVGPDDYNVQLSRDRAVSVLTAMYDILGPQLATPWGDLVVRGLGSSRSTGDPDSDLELDRRVDVIIQGAVRLRS